MKTTTACLLLLAAAVCLSGGTAHAVYLYQDKESAQVCSRICSYERLGIKTYVEACLQGCTQYQNAYYDSGDKDGALATCKAGCPSVSRNICEYGCTAAKRSFP